MFAPDVRLRLAADGLKPRTLLVLDALADHDWTDRQGRRKGVVWPTVATLAKLAGGVTERTAQRHLGLLIRAGYIGRSANLGRGRASVVVLNWPRIVGEVGMGDIPVILPAERVTAVAPPKKPTKSKNQEKPAATASAPVAAPPRRVERVLERDLVPPPPEVSAAIGALFGRIGSPRGESRPAPLRSVLTDRACREAWTDAQLARAREMGLR